MAFIPQDVLASAGKVFAISLVSWSVAIAHPLHRECMVAHFEIKNNFAFFSVGLCEISCPLKKAPQIIKESQLSSGAVLRFSTEALLPAVPETFF